MKKLFVMMSLWLVAVAVMAIPAMPGLWSTIKLSNGKEVRAQLMGDENGCWMQAADGTCYVENNGVYEVADIQELKARQYNRQMSRSSAKRRAIEASTSDGLGQYGKMSKGAVPSIGEYTIPVVMVQFSDTKFKNTTTVEKMTRYYNEEGYHDETGAIGSVRDYFKAQSGGMFIPTFDVVGIVTLPNTAATYGANRGSGSSKEIDYNINALPGDVIAAAISQLGADFSKYVVPAGDANHYDGVPLLAMLYAGQGEATGGSENTIWPCEWDAEDDPVGRETYNGIRFNSFFVGNEVAYGGTKLMGPAVFCHEFGHALGLPDFYVTDYSYDGDNPFGHWSIMDTGAYVDDECRAPMGYNAYEKSYMGWLELKEIGDATEVVLGSPLGTAENSAYILRNSSNETFIFENRQPGTWYPEEFGSGVLVTRIAYNSYDWKYNVLNNTQSKKRACVLTADGTKLYYSAASTNLYGNAKKSIASLKTYSGSTKDIGITNVVKNDDGTITLKLNNTALELPFYEPFSTCSGTGGNDGRWNGSIASKTFTSDNDGWNDNNSGYSAKECARFGKGSEAGQATTPSIAIKGTATLTFKAAAWNAIQEGTTLSLSVSSGTISPASVTLKKAAWSEYTATITATGNAKITFKQSGGRFFLDEVKVVDPNATAIRSVEMSAAKSAAIYTLDGRYVGTDLSVLGHGLYIVGGKKIVR